MALGALVLLITLRSTAVPFPEPRPIAPLRDRRRLRNALRVHVAVGRERITSALSLGVLNASTPSLTAVIAALFLNYRLERIQMRGGLLLGFVGVGVAAGFARATSAPRRSRLAAAVARASSRDRLSCTCAAT